ncbi:MAG: PD-(D/E)XK nuclease-like domain-containing protein, partial [Ruminococcus sp.]|nr:PD-(D/E)XK nuclease-like domain-containing protein [Candidatus Copronaster equi]
MTDREYREYPAISRSSLWKIRESPEKFKYFLENPQKPTPALIFGQVFHKLALEPLTFGEEFAVAPVVDKRTKEGKAAWAEFVAHSDGKTIIDRDMFDKASEMVCALYRAPYVKRLLSGQREVPMFWTDDLTGEPCKCRHDCLTEIGGDTIIVDLKSTADASTEAFMRAAINYGYDLQSSMYSDGYEKNIGRKPKFVFISVEKEPPYAV